MTPVEEEPDWIGVAIRGTFIRAPVFCHVVAAPCPLLARSAPRGSLLQAGTNELLLDDATRMAVRAWRAGVDVVLDVTAGVPHAFQSFAGSPDEADEALDRAALFLTQHLRRA